MTVNATELLSGFLTAATVYILVLHRRLYRAHKRFDTLTERLEGVFYGEAEGVGEEPGART